MKNSSSYTIGLQHRAGVLSSEEEESSFRKEIIKNIKGFMDDFEALPKVGYLISPPKGYRALIKITDIEFDSIDKIIIFHLSIK